MIKVNANVQGIGIAVEHEDPNEAVKLLMATVQFLLASLPKKVQSEEPLPPSVDSAPTPAVTSPPDDTGMDSDDFMSCVRSVMEREGIELPTLRAKLTAYGVDRLAEVPRGQRARFLSELV